MSSLKQLVQAGHCLALAIALFVPQLSQARISAPDHRSAPSEGSVNFVDSPAVPTLLTPLNGAHSVPNAVALRFAPVDGADRYNVQVATDAAFNTIVFQVNVPKSPVAFTAPFDNATYFWRVQSMGVDGASKFSAPFSFSLFAEDECGTDPPMLLTPLNGAAGVPDAVNLRFAPASGAVRYNVQVATDPAFGNIVLAANVPNSPVPFTAPSSNATFYWHVQSVGADGMCKYGATWHFSTSPSTEGDVDGSIDPPELWAPLNGTSDVPDPVQLIFSPMSSAVRYNLQVATDAGFGEIVYMTNIPKPPVWFDTPFDNTTYYWRVQSVGGIEVSKFSAPWSFTSGGSGAAGPGFAGAPDRLIPNDTVRTLHKNFPDPFNPSTTIVFDNPEPGHVKLAVYDLLGREVHRIESRELEAGRHVYRFDASGLSSGSYLYRLESSRVTETRVMTVRK